MTVTDRPLPEPTPELVSAYEATRAAAASAERWLDNYRRRASRTLSQPELDRLLRQALVSIARILKADAASLLLANDEGTALIARAAYGLPREIDLDVSVPAGHGASGPVLSSGQPRFIDDLTKTEVISDTLRLSGQRSYVGVPLISGGRTFGVLHATRLTVSPFSAGDAELLKSFAEPLAVAIERVRLFADERAARHAAEEATAEALRATQRVRGLQSVTAALASAATAEEICDIIVEHVVPGSVHRGERAIWMLRDDRLVLVAGSGESGDYPEIPLQDSALPAGATLREGRPHFVESRAEITRRWPALARSATHAFASIPLIVEGRRVGLMAVGFEEEHVFAGDERDYLVAIAEQAALALARAESQARLEEAWRLADQRRAQLDFLAEASDRLNRSLDVDLTLETIASLAVPRLTDRCALYMLEGGNITKRVVGPTLNADEWELFNRSEENLHALTGVGAVIRTGVPQYVREIDTDAALANIAEDEVRDLFARVGFGGVLILPLRARGRTLGALAFVNRQGRAMEEETVGLASELAARAAVALDNAELYRREYHVARQLLESLLPTRLPEIAGLEVAVSFHPASGGPEVGGDFYDVITLSEDVCLLVVGDVQGKGIEAAALTGLVRTAGKTAAQFTSRPSAILSHLNTTLIDNILQRARGADFPWDDARLCTTAVVRLERRDQGWRLSAAAAGHPPPLLRRADGSIEPASGSSIMLGVDPEATYTESTTVLEAGDSLVLFTDGLTETTVDGGPLTSEGVAAVLRECDGSAYTTTERVAGVALASSGLHDDLVVLTVRVKPSL